MITFKQFLTESRSAPLYHATPFTNGVAILRDGNISNATLHLKYKILKKEDKQGVSTTRSYRFAQSWGRQGSAERSDNSYLIFELDQQKISYNYEVKPVQFWNHDAARFVDSLGKHEPSKSIRNEYEEFIITSTPIPLKYVNKVYYFISLNQHPNMQKSMDLVQDMVNQLRKLRAKYPHIKFVRIEGGESLD